MEIMVKNPYVYYLTRRAVVEGTIERSITCESCGMICATFAHHDDYLKPLEVRWLCKPCHARWHEENGPGLHAELAGLPSIQIKRRDYHAPAPDERDPRFLDMAQMLRDGSSLQEVANKYGLTRERIRQITGSPSRYRMSIGDRIKAANADIVAMRKQGNTYEEIAQKYKVSVSVINKALKGQGIKKPFKHGMRGYQKGCRCSICREANAARARKRYHSRKNRIAVN